MEGDISQPEKKQFSHELAEQSRQEGNAIGPDRELISQTEWKQWLENYIKGFTGNIDHAATLMAAFTEGKNYVYGKLINRGLKHFVRPTTAIVFQENAAVNPVMEANKGQLICIKKSYLEDLSNLDMQAMSTAPRQDGAVIFQGTIPDMFRLFGVEETHHAAFEQIKKGEEKAIDPLSVKMAEYDAREIEYRALKWQVRYAEERHMPSVTINLLRDRLAAAISVRKNQ